MMVDGNKNIELRKKLSPAKRDHKLILEYFIVFNSTPPVADHNDCVTDRYLDRYS